MWIRFLCINCNNNVKSNLLRLYCNKSDQIIIKHEMVIEIYEKMFR